MDHWIDPGHATCFGPGSQGPGFFRWPRLRPSSPNHWPGSRPSSQAQLSRVTVMMERSTIFLLWTLVKRSALLGSLNSTSADLLSLKKHKRFKKVESNGEVKVKFNVRLLLPILGYLLNRASCTVYSMEMRILIYNIRIRIPHFWESLDPPPGQDSEAQNTAIVQK